MRRGAVLVAVAAALVAAAGAVPGGERPAAAYPGSTVEVDGRGWGHARGMSAWGAWGYALNYGWGSPRILDHFYRGTRAGRLSETGPANPQIGVELTDERNRSAWVTAPSGVDVHGVGRATAWFAARVDANKWDLYTGTSCSDAQTRSSNPANKVATVTGVVDFHPIRPTEASLASTNDLLRPCRSGRRYRGWMRTIDSQAHMLTPPYSTINATLLVNNLGLEPYLKGVVPAEIGVSAPFEAQKAQAVAARSFAAHPSRDRPGEAKLVDSVLDQVYRGYDYEAPVTNDAVDSTTDIVRRFTSNGSLAITEYSASSGGHTVAGTYPAVVDLGDDTFTCTGGDHNIVLGETSADGQTIVRAPGCKPGSSRVQLNKRHRWHASVPVSAVESSYGVSGLQQVRVDSRMGYGEWGGRVLDLTIVASSGNRASTGQDFSARFTSYGVYSRWFQIVSRQPGTPNDALPGYWLEGNDGGIFPYGHAPGYGSTGGMRLNHPVVGMAARPQGDGYWIVAADGGIFPFGNAAGIGSLGGTTLNQPIVGMAATPSGKGYWLVASDGGIFPFGDAPGLGSTGDRKLNKPIVGMAATPSGKGYWLVASDGGIFPFGDAPGIGSLGAMTLNSPIVAMAATPTGKGYWLLGGDGGIFPFGDAPGIGSLPGRGVRCAARAMVGTSTGKGYLIGCNDGSAWEFGDAPWLGDIVNQVPGYTNGLRGMARLGA